MSLFQGSGGLDPHPKFVSRYLNTGPDGPLVGSPVDEGGVTRVHEKSRLTDLTKALNKACEEDAVQLANLEKSREKVQRARMKQTRKKLMAERPSTSAAGPLSSDPLQITNSISSSSSIHRREANGPSQNKQRTSIGGTSEGSAAASSNQAKPPSATSADNEQLHILYTSTRSPTHGQNQAPTSPPAHPFFSSDRVRTAPAGKLRGSVSSPSLSLTAPHTATATRRLRRSQQQQHVHLQRNKPHQMFFSVLDVRNSVLHPESPFGTSMVSALPRVYAAVHALSRPRNADEEEDEGGSFLHGGAGGLQ
eukprot:Cvel_8820.t1-p1 / transcript=Cvel_8820.t1 / gene=Cvel_8820 / organism=Chromera_velia_CCMP2878 / gene_product=hypothetical protein / transcript_product=hypothetical protein / location=Cvel_scaffold494:51998-52915(-) / protein_length=306 / sequence_SO=supercontig / SO=protein_coding / is_pseudo=false